jgi:two-component system, cell cycle sensor histidine kinase and response regulator CckA
MVQNEPRTDEREATTGDGGVRPGSAELYRAVIASAPVGVAVGTLDGQMLECNPALARILGHTLEEIRSAGVERLSHPDDLDLDRQLFTELVEGRRDRYQIEKRYFRPDRSIVWCHLTVSLLRREDGTPQMVIGILEDVSERRRACQALAASEAKFRGLFESGMLGVAFGDIDGVTEANQAFLQMVGYRQEDVASGRLLWTHLLVPESAAQDQRALTELAARGVCTPYEKEYFRSDGSRVPVLVGGAIFERQRNQGVVFVLDMSEKRRLEAQFQHAQRLEVVGRLAGGVAHDFNNLLTVVLANAELATATLAADDPAVDYLAQIQEAGARASQLTQQLLAFGRRQIMQPRVFAVDDLVRGTEMLLRRVIREDIALVTALEAEGARVRADRGQLEQVLMNLVVNARDAMLGPGTITITTGREASAARGGDPRVAITVRDTGAGMDEHTLAHVFEPFFTTKPVGRGSGLGLAITYGVIEQSGGTIRVQSAPGAGTTFEILLPETTAPAAPFAAPAAKPMRGSETILVVEDDPGVLNVTSRILEAHGYRVMATSGPEEAMAAAEKHGGPIHLVISDLVMPGMGGLELARRVVQGHPEARVLYVSGYAGDAVPAEVLSGMAGTFLPKPFTTAELAGKVREILDTPTARAP